MKKHLHERRGITFQDYAALLAVRSLLERGDVTTVSRYEDQLPTAREGGHVFNMSNPGSIHGCGTVGCIGGYMGMIMGGSSIPVRHQMEDSSLNALFYPNTGYHKADNSWTWITPKVAVKAIDNWLRTGKPNWKALVPAKLRTKRA